MSIRPRLIVMACLLAFNLTACRVIITHPGPDGSPSHAPPTAVPTDRPDLLDEALQLVGKSRTSFELPHPEETYYRLLCRNPIIDRIMAEPFVLPDFGLYTAHCLVEPQALLEYSIRSSAVIGAQPAKEPTRASAAGESAPWMSIGVTPAALERAIGSLLRAVSDAAVVVKRARGGLTGAELVRLEDDIGGYFFADGTLRFLTSPVKDQFEISGLARKVGISGMLEAQQRLCRAVDDVLPDLRRLADEIDSDTFPVELATADGLVILGGKGADVYDMDACLLVDFGGDDLYLNNAGGTGGSHLPAALVIDLGGKDTYRSRTPAVQGFGYLGVGLLVDEAGDDRYECGDFGQGGGLIGAGLLWDAEGDDRYDGERFTQGAGVFGTGLLVDRAGEDRYAGAFMVQGFGSTLGLGILRDDAGNDQYHASDDAYGFAQGSGCGCRSYPWSHDYSFYGGIGVLVDGGGDDYYRASSFSQGASYFLSLGILVDESGDDYYRGDGSYSHGAGVHLTSGLHLDLSGDDVFVGNWAGTAAGNDRSIGFFVDLQGDDRYAAVSGDGQAYSHKPFGLSVLVDGSGDDVYKSTAYSQAYVLPPINPRNWGDALFIDADGTDSYSLHPRADGMTWHLHEHTAGIDAAGGRVDPFFIKWSDRAGHMPPLDPFQLAAEVQELLEDACRDTSSLLLGMIDSDELARRAGEEAFTIRLLSEQVDDETMPLLGDILAANDPHSRAWAVMTIGLHEVMACGPALLDHLDDPDPYVRSMIHRTVGRLKPEGGAPAVAARLAVEQDTSCRGFLVGALAAYKDETYRDVIIDHLGDTDEFIRYAAAYALVDLPGERATDALLAATFFPSPYTRKAAGEALLQSGDRRGLGPMIDYLQFRALDTSSDNYGSNLGAVLMEYTNEDFGRDYEAWRKWYDAHADTFDLAANLAARTHYLEAAQLQSTGDSEGAVLLFEDALAANPNYRKAAVQYASLLNNLAWGLVTDPHGGNDTEKGLVYAERCVQLDDQAMYLDTLAEAYWRNGRDEDAIITQQRVVEIEPENVEYRTRLQLFLAGRQ
ncbi:HEAT repeat domain-containing protein [bacterium]|nr:HEAT repeat domain-containing protein [candidate division CSSED10-310 bacterium]